MVLLQKEIEDGTFVVTTEKDTKRREPPRPDTALPADILILHEGRPEVTVDGAPRVGPEDGEIVVVTELLEEEGPGGVSEEVYEEGGLETVKYDTEVRDVDARGV